jgi:hypothetical protein
MNQTPMTPDQMLRAISNRRNFPKYEIACILDKMKHGITAIHHNSYCLFSDHYSRTELFDRFAYAITENNDHSNYNLSVASSMIQRELQRLQQLKNSNVHSH